MSPADVAEPVVRPRSSRIPRLNLHRRSGHWRVVLDGRSHYLDKDRVEAQRRYEALLGWRLPQRCLSGNGPALPIGPTVLRVADVAANFIDAHSTNFCNVEALVAKSAGAASTR